MRTCVHMFILHLQAQTPASTFTCMEAWAKATTHARIHYKHMHSRTHTHTNSVKMLCIFLLNEQNNMSVCRCTVRVAPIHKYMHQHHRHPCRTTHIRCTCGHTTNAHVHTKIHTNLKRTLLTYVVYTWIRAKLFACIMCKQNTCTCTPAQLCAYIHVSKITRMQRCMLCCTHTHNK